MQKDFLPFRLALFTLCLLGLFSFRAFAQDKDHDQNSDPKTDHPNGIVQDWSRRHVVYPRFGPIQSLIDLQHDPRAILSWQAAEREDWHRAKDKDRGLDGDEGEGGDRDSDHRHSHGAHNGFHRDWSIGLGSGTTAPAMYPAKYTFDVNATPSCSTDFVVYPVNVGGLSVISATGTVTSGSTTVTITAGTITTLYVGKVITGVGIPAGDTIAAITGNPATSLTLAVAATAGTGTAESLKISGQPNIVAFNNLYSGPTSGICNRTPKASDNGTAATTFWSYNVTASSGSQVTTSPALSMDGTKIAFVESGSATLDFHVLAWRSGDGVDSTNAQNVLLPVTISTFTDPVAPAAGSGTATDLLVGSDGDKLSSPFIDYAHDVAYIGNNSGVLYRVKDVFCTVNPACTGANPPAPTVDSTWGGGSVNTGCAERLTGAVVAGTGNIFVGCGNGKLYGFTPAGVKLTNSPLIVGVGDLSATGGGIVDPPMVDAVNGFVYVVSGTSGVTGVTGSILVQASATDLSSPVVATLGAAGQFNLHAPAFNDAYFSKPFSSVANVQGSSNGGTTSPGTTSNWQIYEWAVTGGVGSLDTIYGVGFNNNHAMTSGAAANFLEISGSTAAEFSPLTEFLNGSTDQLFISAFETAPPNIIVYNLTDFAGLFPNVFPPTNGSSAAGATATEGAGTTGMVVDNVSSSAQASSIYFGVPSLNTAVKLTQSGLQ